MTRKRAAMAARRDEDDGLRAIVAGGMNAQANKYAAPLLKQLAAEREAHTATKAELARVLEVAIAASNDAERALREAGLL